MDIYIDVETRSKVNLKESNVDVYAEDPSFRVLMLSYAKGAGPVQTIDLMAQEIPVELILDLLNPRHRKVAYNAAFEIVTIGTMLARKAGLDEDARRAFISEWSAQWSDAMAWASYNGYIGTLDSVTKALGAVEKEKAGKSLIKLFSVPDKSGAFADPKEYPEAWAEYLHYNAIDVESMRDMIGKLDLVPPVIEEEWHLSFLINFRGVPFNREMLKPAQRIVDVLKDKADIRLREILGITDGKKNPFDAKIKEYIEDKTGVRVGSLKESLMPVLRETFKDYPDILEIFDLRKAKNTRATDKFYAIDNHGAADDRSRFNLRFYGARTGRWSGQGVQVQNFRRNGLKDLDTARNLLIEGNTDALFEKYPELPETEVIGQLARTAIEAPEGRTFLVNDYTAIEARMVASDLLSGEQWRQKSFREGRDLYVSSAAQMFGIDPDTIITPEGGHGENYSYRALGKICELALGYQGSVGSLLSSHYSGTEDEAKELVRKWRETSPKIKALWYDLNRAAVNTVKTGRENRYKRFRFRMTKGRLEMQLPSGRSLYYPGARIAKNKFGSEQIYYGENTSLWSGLLTENATQALARDVLADALSRLERAGFSVIMHIHDEVVIEVEEEEAERALKEVQRIMSQPPEWAPELEGLLDSAGFISPYYMKD